MNPDTSEPEWDLAETHTTRARSQETGLPPVCVDCGVVLEGPNRDGRRCQVHKLEHDAARAREKRAEQRVLAPPSLTRTFTCKDCQQPFTTDKLGRFTRCPSCAERQDLAGRTKTCGYRECLGSFLDTSSQNSMYYCCEEHQRREKLFRLGKAQDVSYFRTPGGSGQRSCVVCKGKFEPSDDAPFGNRCPECREEARHKKCRKCGAEYRDGSENNTRRYCDEHQP